MASSEHRVTTLVDQVALAIGVTAPQQEDDVVLLVTDGTDGCVRQPFPTQVFVAVGLALHHRQHGVQQENTLFGPRGQVSMAGGQGVGFFQHVGQARWDSHSFADREAQSIGLSISMIGILSDNVTHQETVKQRNLHDSRLTIE